MGKGEGKRERTYIEDEIFVVRDKSKSSSVVHGPDHHKGRRGDPHCSDHRNYGKSDHRHPHFLREKNAAERKRGRPFEDRRKWGSSSYPKLISFLLDR